MTVLSLTTGKTAAAGFAAKGRYSYIALLLDFAEWGVDLPDLRKRIAHVNSGEDFSALFGEIIVISKVKSRWSRHADARRILLAHCQTLISAWETTLSSSPDCAQLTLEYLADALKRFEAETQIA